jgi:hypothetical protein
MRRSLGKKNILNTNAARLPSRRDGRIEVAELARHIIDR